MPERQPAIYSVGHSNQTFEQFIALLRRHEIEVLADIRSAPYSRYVPHFNARELRAAITDEGFKYVYLGKELGGRPDFHPDLYDDEGRALYARISTTPVFQSGIQRLMQGIARYRVAMMCSEEDPSECHRRLLVGAVLADRGVAVHHIRGDGRLDSDSDLPQPAHTQPLQASIFDDVNRDDLWRSTRSVLPRSPRSGSSAS